MRRPALITFGFFLLLLCGVLELFAGATGLAFGIVAKLALYTGFLYLFAALCSFSAAYGLWTFQAWTPRALIGVSLLLIALAMLSLVQMQGFGSVVTNLVVGSPSSAVSALPSAFLSNLIVGMSLVLVAVAIFLTYVALSPEFANLYGQQGVSVGAYSNDRPSLATESRARSSSAAYLISAIGSDGVVARREISAAQPTCVIGRSSDQVDLCLADETVSRVHAKFALVGDDLMLRDLGSSNRTLVDGREIGGTPVRVGVHDKIVLGAVKLVVSRV